MWSSVQKYLVLTRHAERRRWFYFDNIFERESMYGDTQTREKTDRPTTRRQVIIYFENAHVLGNVKAICGDGELGWSHLTRRGVSLAGNTFGKWLLKHSLALTASNIHTHAPPYIYHSTSEYCVHLDQRQTNGSNGYIMRRGCGARGGRVLFRIFIRVTEWVYLLMPPAECFRHLRTIRRRFSFWARRNIWWIRGLSKCVCELVCVCVEWVCVCVYLWVFEPFWMLFLQKETHMDIELMWKALFLQQLSAALSVCIYQCPESRFVNFTFIMHVYFRSSDEARQMIEGTSSPTEYVGSLESHADNGISGWIGGGGCWGLQYGVCISSTGLCLSSRIQLDSAWIFVHIRRRWKGCHTHAGTQLEQPTRE